jgi:hypothetical protein
MSDYSEAKIYFLKEAKDDQIFYVGHTTMSLEERLYFHKYCVEKGSELMVHQYIIINDVDFYIDLHQDYPCETKSEIEAFEGEVIRDLKSQGIKLMNKNIPGRTMQEWYYDNHEDNLRKAKEYREKHHDRLTAVHQCQECDGTFTYWQSYHHKRSPKHRLAIGLEPLTFDCECGAKALDVNNKHHHLKTLRHLKFYGRESEYVHQEKPGEYTCACGTVLWNNEHKIKRHEKSATHKFFLLPQEEKDKIITAKAKAKSERRKKYQNEWYKKKTQNKQ